MLLQVFYFFLVFVGFVALSFFVAGFVPTKEPNTRVGCDASTQTEVTTQLSSTRVVTTICREPFTRTEKVRSLHCRKGNVPSNWDKYLLKKDLTSEEYLDSSFKLRLLWISVPCDFQSRDMFLERYSQLLSALRKEDWGELGSYSLAKVVRAMRYWDNLDESLVTQTSYLNWPLATDTSSMPVVVAPTAPSALASDDVLNPISKPEMPVDVQMLNRRPVVRLPPPTPVTPPPPTNIISGPVVVATMSPSALAQETTQTPQPPSPPPTVPPLTGTALSRFNPANQISNGERIDLMSTFRRSQQAQQEGASSINPHKKRRV